MPLLEKQALRFLKLEDDLAKSKNQQVQRHVTYFKTIIAACCYIQTKQAQKWQIPMKDYQRICKVLEIRKCSRAIDFVEKWQSETQKTDAENVNPNTTSEEAMDSCQAEKRDEENAAEMLAFSNKPRQSQPVPAQGAATCGSESTDEYDEEYKSKWFH